MSAWLIDKTITRLEVGDDGQVILSHAIEASEHARAYAVQHVKGKFFGRPRTGRASYFTWHRQNKFLGGP